MLRGKRKSLSSSWLDKEIRRLECFANYNSAPSIVKGKGHSKRKRERWGDSAEGALQVFGFFSIKGFSCCLGSKVFCFRSVGVFSLEGLFEFFWSPSPLGCWVLLGRWVLVLLFSFLACLLALFVYSVCTLLRLFASAFNTFCSFTYKKIAFSLVHANIGR